MSPAPCPDFNLKAVLDFFDGLLREICWLLPMNALRYSPGARYRRNMGDPCCPDRESGTSIADIACQGKLRLPVDWMLFTERGVLQAFLRKIRRLRGGECSGTQLRALLPERGCCSESLLADFCHV